MPESAIKFGSYEFAKKIMAQLEGHNDPQAINPFSKFMAGGIGGLVSQWALSLINWRKHN
jgi:solute carrier family 25 phosphate transporter 23/24/25/41